MFLCAVLLLLGWTSSTLANNSTPVSNSTLPVVDLGYELHQATINVSEDTQCQADIQLACDQVTNHVQATGQYYNFSNVRYAAPPLGNLRFAAPTQPSNASKVFNDGSKAVTCIQAVPAWGNYSLAWVTEGTAAFNIPAGYHPPNLTTLPPADPTASEDCLFLDLMVPQAIFNNAGKGAGAPV